VIGQLLERLASYGKSLDLSLINVHREPFLILLSRLHFHFEDIVQSLVAAGVLRYNEGGRAVNLFTFIIQLSTSVCNTGVFALSSQS
jgi:hypothetical protein